MKIAVAVVLIICGMFIGAGLSHSTHKVYSVQHYQKCDYVAGFEADLSGAPNCQARRTDFGEPFVTHSRYDVIGSDGSVQQSYMLTSGFRVGRYGSRAADANQCFAIALLLLIVFGGYYLVSNAYLNKQLAATSNGKSKK